MVPSRPNGVFTSTVPMVPPRHAGTGQDCGAGWLRGQTRAAGTGWTALRCGVVWWLGSRSFAWDERNRNVSPGTISVPRIVFVERSVMQTALIRVCEEKKTSVFFFFHQ